MLVRGIAQQIHGAGGDNERLGRVESPGDADDHFADAGALEAFHQPVHLDIVGFVATPVAYGRIAGDVGETIILALAQQPFALWQVERHADITKLADRVAVVLHALTKTRLAHAFLRQAVQIKVGQHQL